MGWDFGWSSKKEAVAALKGRPGEGFGKRLIKSKLVGNHLWFIAESFGEPYIGLYLLSRYEGSWGYKALTEYEGPYYYSCPLSFLAEVPVPEKSPYALGWRGKVLEWHRKKLEKAAAKALAAA